MRRSAKWTLPVMAAAVLLVGFSSSTAQAQKANVTGTVKQADGTPAAAGLTISIYKGDVQAALNQGGRGGRRGGGAGGPPAGQQAGPGGAAPAAPGAGAGAGAPPAPPTAAQTATTDDKGAFAMKDLDPGQYTIMAGNAFGGGRRGGGAGGPPAGQQAGPGGAAPAAPGAGPGAGAGGRGGGFGRVVQLVDLKAGDNKIDLQLQAGRGGGRNGGGGAGGAGGGAGGAGGGAGGPGGAPAAPGRGQ